MAAVVLVVVVIALTGWSQIFAMDTTKKVEEEIGKEESTRTDEQIGDLLRTLIRFVRLHCQQNFFSSRPLKVVVVGDQVHITHRTHTHTCMCVCATDDHTTSSQLLLLFHSFTFCVSCFYFIIKVMMQ